ncbi:MAG: hypothetical protein JWO03_841 [Bacteroidetes bacterium]|nr:hypothetical protein [Bacteroidota bacterium]
MQSYITAYKKELKEIRDRDMGGQSTSYPPGSDPELSMQLELAGLHVKYNDLISDKGYNWTELYRLMCAADDSRVNDTICHNIEK